MVDKDGVLRGSLSLDRILVNQSDILVADVMRDDVLQLNPLDDMDDAAQAFERYDLVSAPVVDGQNRLVGRLTIDEVVDAIREQGESEVLAQVGLKRRTRYFFICNQRGAQPRPMAAGEFIHRGYSLVRRFAL